MLFMDDKTWQFRKLKSHCGGHLFCSVAVLIFFDGKRGARNEHASGG